MMIACHVCASFEWRPLPTPDARMVMTTAGKLVPGPLGKAQCPICGAVQKVNAKALADTDYYERSYTYYDRPGAPTFDIVRYRALAQWVIDAVAPDRPTRVFDVGCGRGGTMQYLRDAWPKSKFAGLEPFPPAVEAAQTLGFEVTEGRLSEHTAVDGGYDLVFSNNVLQHTTDPVAFVAMQARLLAPGGRIVLSCPDGTEPSVELMMADQNVSLRPEHLVAIAAKAGMSVERRLPCPGGPLRNEQLVVMRPAAHPPRAPLPARTAIDMAYDGLIAYLEAWRGLDARLQAAIAGARRVFNFGGGLWTYVLAAYCPNYWARVECCLVDGFAGRCLDREVRRFEDAGVTPGDILVLGTNPYAQPKLAARFSQAGLRAVAWNDVIPH